MISTRSSAIRFGVSHTWPIKSSVLGAFNSNFDIKVRRFCYNFFNRILFNRSGIALAGLILHRYFTSFLAEVFLQDVKFLDWLSKRPGFSLFGATRKSRVPLFAPKDNRYVGPSFRNYFFQRSLNLQDFRKRKLVGFLDKYELASLHKKYYPEVSNKVFLRQPRRAHLAVHSKTFFSFRGKPTFSLLQSYLKRIPRGWSSLRRFYFKSRKLRRFLRPRYRLARVYKYKNIKARWLAKTYAKFFNTLRKAKLEGLSVDPALKSLNFTRLRRAVLLKHLRKGRQKFKFTRFRSWLKETTPWRFRLKRSLLALRRRSKSFLSFQSIKPYLSRIGWRFRVRAYRELVARRIIRRRLFPHAPFPPHDIGQPSKKAFGWPSANFDPIALNNPNFLFRSLGSGKLRSDLSVPISFSTSSQKRHFLPWVGRLRRYLDLVLAVRVFRIRGILCYPYWIPRTRRRHFKSFILHFSKFPHLLSSRVISNYFRALSSDSKSSQIYLSRFSRFFYRTIVSNRKKITKALSLYTFFVNRLSGPIASSDLSQTTRVPARAPKFFRYRQAISFFTRGPLKRLLFKSVRGVRTKPGRYKRALKKRLFKHYVFRFVKHRLFSSLPHQNPKFSLRISHYPSLFGTTRRSYARLYAERERYSYPRPSLSFVFKSTKRRALLPISRFKRFSFPRFKHFVERPRRSRRRLVRFWRRRFRIKKYYPRPALFSIKRFRTFDKIGARINKLVNKRRRRWTRGVSYFAFKISRRNFIWSKRRFFYRRFMGRFTDVASRLRRYFVGSPRHNRAVALPGRHAAHFISNRQKALFRPHLRTSLRNLILLIFSDFSYYCRAISLFKRVSSGGLTSVPHKFFSLPEESFFSIIFKIFKFRIQRAFLSYRRKKVAHMFFRRGGSRVVVGKNLYRFYRIYLFLLKSGRSSFVSPSLLLRIFRSFFFIPSEVNRRIRSKSTRSFLFRKRSPKLIQKKFPTRRSKRSRRFYRPLRRFSRFFPKPTIVYPLRFFYRFSSFSRLRLISFYSRLCSFLARYYFGVPIFFRINLLAYTHTLDFYLNFITTRLYYRYILSDVLKPIVRLARHYYRGFRIVCNGRFTRAQMATSRVYRVGSLRSSEVTAPIFYGQRFVVLKYGVCNIKIWLRFLQFVFIFWYGGS